MSSPAPSDISQNDAEVLEKQWQEKQWRHKEEQRLLEEVARVLQTIPNIKVFYHNKNIVNISFSILVIL